MAAYNLSGLLNHNKIYTIPFINMKLRGRFVYVFLIVIPVFMTLTLKLILDLFIQTDIVFVFIFCLAITTVILSYMSTIDKKSNLSMMQKQYYKYTKRSICIVNGIEYTESKKSKNKNKMVFL